MRRDFRWRARSSCFARKATGCLRNVEFGLADSATCVPVFGAFAAKKLQKKRA
jgi:hypothetical protein